MKIVCFSTHLLAYGMFITPVQVLVGGLTAAATIKYKQTEELSTEELD